MECEQYGKSIWWMIYTEKRLISVVLKRQRWKGEHARMLGANGRRYKSSFGKAVIRELLVLLCLLLGDGLTVLSMWAESMNGSCM